MKVSELQKVLSKVKEQYGDLPVEIVTGSNLVRLFYGEVNDVRIVRTDEPQFLKLGETLDDNVNTRLRLIRISEEED